MVRLLNLQMTARSLLLSLVLIASSAGTQTPGSCVVGTALGTLDASDVELTVPNTGTLFYGPDSSRATGPAPSQASPLEHAYYVPKESGLSPLYAVSLWIGGRVGGEVRTAGTLYGQGGEANDHYEFWPGPLNDDGTLPDPADCSAYDRIWVVSARDLAAYEAGGAPAADLAEWPVGLGAPAVDAAGEPVEVTGRDQVINLAAGERPVVSGSQTAFWVMNDVGNEHRTTGSDPLGVEVAVTAFVTARSDDPLRSTVLDQASFYRFEVTNRTSRPIEDLHVGWFVDPDLGNPSDDFTGMDTTRAMAYVYNADEMDDGAYRSAPPAVGVDFLSGAAAGGSFRSAAATSRWTPQSTTTGSEGSSQTGRHSERGDGTTTPRPRAR